MVWAIAITSPLILQKRRRMKFELKRKKNAATKNTTPGFDHTMLDETISF